MLNQREFPACAGEGEGVSLERVRDDISDMLLEAVEIGNDDNLLSLGLDSLKIMRLLGKWRRAGAEVTFAELIETPTLSHWAYLLGEKCSKGSRNRVETRETPTPENTGGAFPLTDVQHAYWIGRSDGQPLGGNGCHAYLEIDGRGVEPHRLEAAWNLVLETHSMLRARFLSDGTQDIQETTCTYRLPVHNLGGDSDKKVQQHLTAIRDRLSHRRCDVEKGDVAGLELSLLPGGETRIHFDIDLLVADVQSLQIILRDLASAYVHKPLPAPVKWRFSNYLKEASPQRLLEEKRACRYWKQRLDNLPGAPALPLVQAPEELHSPVFRRRRHDLGLSAWTSLKAKAAEHQVTPAMVFLAAYVDVLERWSTNSHFLINIPLFDRETGDACIEDVVADFTNLLLLEADCRTPQTFVERVRSIQAQFHKDAAHSAYSGVQVQRDLARLRQGETLFAPVVFACNLGAPLIGDEGRNTLGDLSYMISQTPQVWLDFQLYETSQGLILAWDSVDALFPAGLMDEMFEAFCACIAWLVSDGNNWHASPDVLPEAQRQRKKSEADFQVPTFTRCLHTSFFEYAAEHPLKEALIEASSGTHMSHGELSDYALQVAGLLRKSGVTPGSPVAIILPRGIGQIAAVLGVLALGGCYVPISVDQPRNRRDYILEQAAVTYILTSRERAQGEPWPESTVVLDIDAAEKTTPQESFCDVSADDLAYIIFTSGSTGKPKGVEISHGAAWNTISELNQRYTVNSSDRMLALAALEFDLSVYDIFGVLGVGGALVLISEETRRDAPCWLNLLQDHQVTLWNSVPALLEMLLVVAESRGLGALPLRMVMLSGDWIGMDIPSRLKRVADGCRLVAMGGATEASIWSNVMDVLDPIPDHWKSIPYGRPLPNQVFRVVDDKGRDCPDWVAGELWIGGAGVARGYRGDLDLSADRFVSWNGMRWFRTGDLGRFWPDGILEFLGREDFQVKVMGHRIELGEIEGALKQHPKVHEAVVSAVDDTRGGKRLVGYLVQDSQEGGASAKESMETGYEVFGRDGAVLVDPVERLAFKMEKKGVRRKETDAPRVSFPRQPLDDSTIDLYSKRLSYRSFDTSPLGFHQLRDLLQTLAAIEIPEVPFPKYRYGSAGGLYPVQVYVAVKQGRVGRLAEGVYYYNPMEQSLDMVSEGPVAPDIVSGSNTAIFEASAFALFLVADFDAIVPVYGTRSRDFCLIEAGLIAQLLETACFSSGIGLCQIGVVDFQKIEPLFRLTGDHECLLCLFGGGVTQPEGWSFLHEAAQEGHPFLSGTDSDDAIRREILGFLREKLPEYMVPSALIFLEQLPLSSNGKVDRKALPVPGGEWLDSRKEIVPPRTVMEAGLLEMWQELLSVNQISIHDSFFELGGDSLLAVQLVARIRKKFAIELAIGTLFELPDIAGLSGWLSAALDNGTSSETLPVELPELVKDEETRHLPFPLTDIQQAYWIGRMGAFELGNVSTHFYIELENRDLEIEALNAAWRMVIDRHEMLRAVVLPDGRQQILDDVPPYEFDVMDLRGKSDDATQGALESIRQRMSHQVLSPDVWPLFDIRVTRFDRDRVRLHISFDAQMVDAWSFFSLISDWYHYYNCHDQPLAPLELSFRDYVLAEKCIETLPLYERDKAYWLEKLATLPPAPELPLVRNPAGIEKPRFHRRSFSLESQRWNRVKTLASQYDLTPAGVLLAIYADILRLWSKNPKFTINLTLFNRLPMDSQVNDIVGDFTSLVLLAVDLPGEGSFVERALSLQKQLWEDLDHRYFSGIRVLREMARQRGEYQRSAMPVVFTSALNMDSLNRDVSGFSKLGEWVYGVSQTPQVWLDQQVYEQDGDLILIWDAVESLFPEGVLDHMFGTYQRTLERLCDGENVWHESLRPTAPAAQLEIRDRANDTDAAVSSQLLHTMFDQVAVAHPDQLAVVSRQRALGYGEVWRLAKAIGGLLVSKGARPNSLVAVVMEKGWEQVVASLGVLYAGAAYLPIDPTLPSERLRLLMHDGEVSIALTQPGLDTTLEWPEGVTSIAVDTEGLEGSSSMPIPDGQTPGDLAYVIYTSGSTGLPKGVMIQHGGAVNTILDINRRFGVGARDRVLSLSQLNFDLSVYDFFGALSAGAAVILPDADKAKDPGHWLALMEREQVTIWNTVPALMQMLLEYLAGDDRPVPQSLRLVLLSGDWIPPDLPDRIRSRFAEAKVIALGGATEASIWSNIYPVESINADWKSIPYGGPMTNQRYHILDEEMNDCPDWKPGQLYIGGMGLALGYWKDETKTRQSFVIHPRTGERLYRTGDLGCYWPDGTIEFLGREDDQVKISGHRIELGEVESVIKGVGGIKDSVVMALGDAHGDKRLVGYVVPDFREASHVVDVKRGDADVSDAIWKTVVECAVPTPTSSEADAAAGFLRDVDRLTLLVMWRVLQGLGIFSRSNVPYSVDEVMQEHQLEPRYRVLILQWLRALVDEGSLRVDSQGRYVAMDASVAGLDDDPGAPGVLSRQGRALYSLLIGQLPVYIDLLTGRTDPLALFFSGDSFLTAENLERFIPGRGYFHALAQEMFESILSAFPAEHPPQVLELGTRAGGLTEALAPLVSRKQGRYLYVDESDFFLDKVKKATGGTVSPEFGLFDMNQTLCQPDYESHSFDIIIADHTLHRAKHAGKTLALLQRLLAPGGLLIFMEPTRSSRLMLTTVGFLEDGFSRLEDDRKESLSPLYTVDAWVDLINRTGFSQVMSFPAPGHPAEVFGQHLLVARAPSSVPVFNPHHLAESLEMRLPDYMVPSSFFSLDGFPLSPNGKLDRRALAELGKVALPARRGNYVAPSSDIEVQIAEVWAEILGCSQVGRHDNFFELGGDSLKAIQCVNLLKERYQLDLSLQQFFEKNSIALLSQQFEMMVEGEI